MAGVRSLASPVQSRVATVTLDMAEHYPNKSIWVSHVAVPRKHLGLEECIELSAHVLVAGRRAGSVKCTSACRSASTSTRVSGCPRRAHGGKRKIHPFIRCSRVHLTLIRRRQPRKWGEDCWERIFLWFRGYELQRRKGMQESQTEKEEMRQQQRMKIMTDMIRTIKSKGRMGAKNSWWSAFLNGSGSGNTCPGSCERPHGAPNFPPQGRRGLHYMRRVTPRGSTVSYVVIVLVTRPSRAWRSSREWRTANPHGQAKSDHSPSMWRRNLGWW